MAWSYGFLGLHLAPGDRDALPVHGLAARQAEPEDGVRDLHRLNEAALGIGARERLPRFLGTAAGDFLDVRDSVPDEVGLGVSGTHGVHRDVALGDLERERARQPDDAVLGRAVGR